MATFSSAPTATAASPPPAHPTHGDQGPDQVYAFVPSATGRYTFAVTPTTSWDSAIYLLSSCPATTGDLASCVVGADEHASSTTPEGRRLTGQG